MPYAKNENLPNNIKNVLPESAQSIWRGAFNAAFERYQDDGKASQIAWGAVKNAGWTKDEKGIWHKLNSETISDVEIFSTGIHNGDKYTDEDLDDIVNNFNELKDDIKPPCKLGHSGSIKSDGQPAMGWVTALKRSGNKLIATFSDVPGLLAEAIRKKLYKRTSSEIYWNYPKDEKIYKRVLRGVAFLGADIPMVKNLQDLRVLFSEDNANIHIVEYSENIIKPAAITGHDSFIIAEKEKIMEEKILKEYQEKLEKASADMATLRAEVKEYKEKFENSEKEKADREKAEKIKLFTETQNKFREKCEAYVKAGKMPPAGRDILVNYVSSKQYSEGTDINIPIDVLEKYIDKVAEILNKNEIGLHGTLDLKKSTKSTYYSERDGAVVTGVDLDAEVKEYLRKNPTVKTYAEAMVEVLRSNDALAETWAKEGA